MGANKTEGNKICALRSFSFHTVLVIKLFISLSKQHTHKGKEETHNMRVKRR